MTVKELREKLNEFGDHLEVVLVDYSDQTPRQVGEIDYTTNLDAVVIWPVIL